LVPRGIEAGKPTGLEAGRQKILVKIYLTTIPRGSVPFSGIEDEVCLKPSLASKKF